MNDELKIILFGASSRGRDVMESLPPTAKIICFADNDPQKQSTPFIGLPVITPSKIPSLDYDFIVISSIFSSDIFRQLLDMRIPSGKIATLSYDAGLHLQTYDGLTIPIPHKYASLPAVRSFLSEKKSASHTTLQYQSDVFEQLINGLAAGDCVIEVGSYKGGLSCQLAFLLENTGKFLVLIDIVDEYLQWIKDLVSELQLTTPIVFFSGTLPQFINENPDIHPSLIIVDADHRYEGVDQDIRAIRRMPHPPLSVIFHDVSLRYCRGRYALQIRVDLAVVHHYLMHGYKFKKIGAIGQQELQRVLNVSEEKANHHYHDTSFSEGIQVVLNEKAFRHFSPWVWQTLDVWPQGRAGHASVRLKRFVDQKRPVDSIKRSILRIFSRRNSIARYGMSRN